MRRQSKPLWNFKDSEEVGGILNDIGSHVITSTLTNFDVSKIFIDRGSSYDIIYAELFEKLGSNKENLSPFMSMNFEAFNGFVTRPWGFIDIMVTFCEGREAKTMDVLFLVVPCKRFYNRVFGRKFRKILGIS